MRWYKVLKFTRKFALDWCPLNFGIFCIQNDKYFCKQPLINGPKTLEFPKEIAARFTQAPKVLLRGTGPTRIRATLGVLDGWLSLVGPLRKWLCTSQIVYCKSRTIPRKTEVLCPCWNISKLLKYSEKFDSKRRVKNSLQTPREIHGLASVLFLFVFLSPFEKENMNK